jgi:glucokinase
MTGSKGSYTVGVDVGGTKVAYGLFDARKRRVARGVEATSQGLAPERFLEGLVEGIVGLCAGQGVDVRDLRGVGIGMPCFIRQADGHIIKSSNIPTLHDFSARAMLTDLLEGTPVELGNDTHAAALAESRGGAGQGRENMLYCSVSSGIASAPIIGGRLFRGSYGFSGESGHMLITPGQGVRCACGKQGCFMSWCSGHMIVQHVRNWIAAGEQTAMVALAGGIDNITTAEIRQAAEEGDSLALRAIEQMQHYLALWLFNLYVFTNIDCFVLGGGLLKMGTAFWQEVERRFCDLNDSDCPACFLSAQLGDDTGIIGANEFLY